MNINEYKMNILHIMNISSQRRCIN